MDMKEKATVIRESEVYFDLMRAFLSAQASVLNETLKEFKVNAAKRQEICETFGMSMGQFYDMQWVGVDGKRYFPQLMFSEGFLTEKKTLGDIGAIYAFPVTDEFHPIGVDAATQYFEEKSQKLGAEELGVVTPDDQLPPQKRIATKPSLGILRKSGKKKAKRK
jgi:hypothetical protein